MKLLEMAPTTKVKTEEGIPRIMADRLTLYHNPKCSKSRAAKALLDTAGADYDVRLYLDDPLSYDELERICSLLEHDEAHALLRQKEARAAGWAPTAGHDTRDILRFLAKHPQALERPIVANGERAVIGRPTDRVQELL